MIILKTIKFATGRKFIAIVIFSLFLSSLSWTFYNYHKFIDWSTTIELNNKRLAKQEALKVAKEIDETLEMVERAATTLAEELSNGTANLNNLEIRQRKITADNPKIFGLGTAFIPEVVQKFPNVPEGKGRPKEICTSEHLADSLYAPYLHRVGQESDARETVFVNDFYDYTCNSKYWYVCPLGLNPNECPSMSGAMWLEPYFGEASKKMVEEYGVPFYLSKDKTIPTGVVWANMTLDDFNDLLNSFDIGNNGYSFLLSPKGIFVAHPRKTYIERSKTIADDSKLHNAFIKAKQGKTQIVKYVDPLTNKDAWWLFQPIPRANWVLGMVMIEEDLSGDNKDNFRWRTKLTIYILISFILATLLINVTLKKTTEGFLWVESIIITIGLAMAIVTIWYLLIQYPIYDKAVSKQYHNLQKPTSNISFERNIVNSVQLNRFKKAYLEQQSQVGNLKDRNVIFLPTGIFIQSIQFLGTNEIGVSGYIWQQLPPDDKACLYNLEESTDLTFMVQSKSGSCKTIEAGVIFPQAKKIERLDIAYQHNNANGELTVGWYFHVILRQNFSYGHYPFEIENIWLRFRHKEIGSNVVLIPDIKSYPILTSTILPGLEVNLVLPDWEIKKSFFNYKTKDYNTNFGIADYSGAEQFPELHFNILLIRKFVEPFISYLMPVIVIAVILFAVLLIITNSEEKKIMGFSTSGVLGSCAGLFFGVLIGHSKLSASLKAPGIVYMEFFYMIMYVALLLVAANAYLFSVNKKVAILQWHDNLLPKLMYWPMLLFLVLLVTLKDFYFH